MYVIKRSPTCLREGAREPDVMRMSELEDEVAPFSRAGTVNARCYLLFTLDWMYKSHSREVCPAKTVHGRHHLAILAYGDRKT